jgi:hypothetical protein
MGCLNKATMLAEIQFGSRVHMPPLPEKMTNNFALIHSQPKHVCKVSPKTDMFCGLCKKSFMVYVKKKEIVI